MANSGAGNLTRFARTAPSWTNQVRSYVNPASIEWKPKATTGNNHYFVNKTDAAGLLPTTSAGYQFTISAWIRPTATLPLGVWSVSSGNPQPLVGMTIMSSGGLPKIAIQEGFVAQHISGAISQGSWNHIVVSVSELTGKVFINGAFATTIAWSAPPDMATYTQFRVGEDGGVEYEGAFSDIAIFNGAFAEQVEVDALYNNGAVFNLSEPTIPPLNPLRAQMTAVWDGSDTGTTTIIAPAKSSRGNPAFVDASLKWTGTLLDVPSLNPDLRPSASGNNYSRLALLAQAWNAGTAIDGLTALGAGVRIDEYAPALLPFPFAGWGFKSSAGSVVGVLDVPQATPLLSTATSLQDPKMASNPTVGTGTLQGALDSRSAVVLKPTFAVK